MMWKFLTELPLVVRYLLAGGTSTAVDLGLLFVLTEYAGWWYLASATAAFSVAVFVSFTLQKFYTFQHRDASRGVVATQSALFLALQFTNIGINTLLMYALVEWFGLHYFLAQIIAAAAIAAESFFAYRLVIFHPSAPLAYLVPRLSAFFTRHRSALALALAISLLYGAHHFLMPRFMPEGFVYKPVTFESDPDAGGYYGPRANAFFTRSELPLPSLLPILNPLIMGGLGKVLGNIERAFIVSDFLFPPLIFLAVYLLFYEVVRRCTPALVLASVFMVSPLAALFSPSSHILAEAVPLYFSSFEYPKITFLFYALALLFIFRTLARDSKKNIILAGIFFGTLFYTYLYDWAYLAVALGLSFLWFMLRREWDAVKACAGILGIGGALSLPYWLNFLALRRLSHYGDIIFRIGIEEGRAFRFWSVWKSYARHLVWIIALTATTLKRIPRQTIFLVSLLAAYFVVVNVQVVIGFSPHPDHWYRETFLPLFLALGMVGVWIWEHYLARRVPTRRVQALFFILLALFFAHAFVAQYRMSRDEAARWGISLSYLSGYEWLTHNTPVGSSVGSVSPETNREIALFTHNRVFTPSGGLTQESHEDLWKRIIMLTRIYGFTAMECAAYAAAHESYFFHEFYRPRAFDHNFSPAQPGVISPTERAKWEEQCARETHELPHAYLFVGPREEAVEPLSDAALTARSFEKVYEHDTIRIYRFRENLPL